MKVLIPKFSITQDKTIINVFHANTGEGLPSHIHNYEHLVFCHAGKLIVRKEGRELMMTKDTQPVNLIANEYHEVEVLEDSTVFVNIFNASQIILNN